MKSYRVSRDTLMEMYLENYLKGMKDTRFLFPLNLILMGIYSLAVCIIFIIVLPIFIFVVHRKLIGIGKRDTIVRKIAPKEDSSGN